MSFGDWLISLSIMTSRLIQVVAKGQDLLNNPLYVYAAFSLSIHLSKDIWVASTSWLL